MESKRIKRIKETKTTEGHKAIICEEIISHHIIPVKHHVAIFSLEDKELVIYGKVFTTGISDAEQLINNFKSL